MLQTGKEGIRQIDAGSNADVGSIKAGSIMGIPASSTNTFGHRNSSNRARSRQGKSDPDDKIAKSKKSARATSQVARASFQSRLYGVYTKP
jgi:hypothetical protein